MARSVTVPPAPPMAGAEGPAPARRPLWRNGGFLVIVVGQFASNAGSGATQIALPLLMLALTNSPLQASVFEALRLGLYACTAVPAGVLVDRVSRRAVMIVCDFVRAFLLATIPVAAFYGRLSVTQLYVVVAIEAVLWTVFDLSATALLPSLVADDQVNDVGAAITLANNAQQFIGQPLGAAIMTLGRFIPFAVNAVTYLVSALSLLCVRVPSTHDAGAPAPNDAPEAFATPAGPDEPQAGSVDMAPPTARSAARGLFAGFRWLFSHRLLRTLALVCSLANLALAGYTLLLLVLLRALGATPAEVAVALLAAGVGSLVGPALGAALGRRVPAMLIFLLGLPIEAGL
jgi:predicted MFS family arabinose efflux permease